MSIGPSAADARSKKATTEPSSEISHSPAQARPPAGFDSGDGFGGRAHVSCGDRHGCALLGEDLCDTSANSPRTASHDRDSPIQMPLHRVVCDPNMQQI